VRSTFDDVLVVAAPKAGAVAALDSSGQVAYWLKFPGSEPATRARVLGSADRVLALVSDRKGRDLRPLELAPKAASLGVAVGLLAPTRAPFPNLEPKRVTVADDARRTANDPSLAWLAEAPAAADSDRRPPEERARVAEGGLVLDARGRLAGFVTGALGPQVRVNLAAPAVARLGDALLRPPGADLIQPDDGFLEYGLRIESVSDLPRCEKDEGQEPMLVLEIRVANELAGRVEVTPGREIEPARVVARSLGPVEVHLVALDRSIAKGETREELARPAVFPALQPRLVARLELKPEALEHHPAAASGPRVAHAVLTFKPLDPDGANGPKRSPLGATSLALGRLGEGQLDLPGGAATDFLSVEADAPVPAVALLYKRTLGARLRLQAWSPGLERQVLDLTTEEGAPRVAVAEGELRRGRTLVRLRQIAGETGTAYELLIANRTDASGIVRPLFGLVATEASRDGTAFLDSDNFVDEVARALEALGLSKDDIATAILDRLGSQVVQVRRLAFLLLERHFPPKREVLVQFLGEGNQDAGLLLAELDPKDATLRPLLRKVARDTDPYVRARALRVASRSGDAAFAEELANALENDSAPVVERAVAAARLAASRLRAESQANASEPR
jgi:hypothetical protein